MDGQGSGKRTYYAPFTMDVAETMRTWFRGRKAARDRALDELHRSLALIVEPEALEASFVARTKELFDPDRLLLLQLDRGRSTLRPTSASGIPESATATLTVNGRGRLARWLLLNESCLWLPRDRDVLNYISRADRGLIKNLGLHACAPLRLRSQVTGLVMLGWENPARSARRAGPELLIRVADQASMAFQNAHLYREQQDRLDRMHRADRLAAVGQLAASVAHEVRNPLTSIRSTMQYLERAFDATDDRRSLVHELVEEVDRINATVSGLLSLSRTRGSRREEIDLGAVLEATTQLIMAQARKQGVQVDLHGPAQPLRLQADPHGLKQVFLNLQLNALQAMPDGGTLTVGIHIDHQPGTSDSGVMNHECWLRVLIADTGPGIPQSELRRVFDPFFTTKKEGTGLGLAICHGIVEDHQGEIVLQAEDGRGTTAVIRLPTDYR